ncbi:MAG TPA: hypothetical protein VKV21_01240 [Solirubrobacteraceae bacterium]|nr:hypothetical protein [Solirubrobacteraceae bacterium]
MSVLALDLALVRDVLLPGLTLSPGRGMMARVVASDEGSGGRLAIAGYLLEAELPRELAAGQSLRLVVRDVSGDRVLLSVDPHDTAAPTPAPEAPPPLAAPIPLPGGAQLQVLPDGGEEQSRGGSGRSGDHALALRLDLPGLGPLELRFGLDAASVRAAIAADPGEALAHAQAGAGELRDALTRVCERPATVTVIARRRPLDVYA